MNEIFCAIYQIVKDWQTLMASLIAVVAAIQTIRLMRKQGMEEDQRHQNQMRRKEMAARSQMPDALSEMSAYARSVGEFLLQQSPTLPDAPTSAIAALKQVIEHIDNDAAQRVFQLVSWYQVHRARTSSGNTPVGGAESLYDIVLLQSYVNGLFGYARNEEQTVSILEPSHGEMSNALSNVFTLPYIVQNESVFEELKVVIERRHLPA